MEFKFAVNDVFRQPVVQIGPSLLPPGFTGDRRAFWDTVGKVSEVVNAMGEASAAAQGLTKPITTADRLRNSEHNLYLLIDQNAANGRGAVTGMLKTGKKGLYVFDRNGQHFQVSPPCVLDFYVHESRQRTGLGKRLFEHMLQIESIEPVKMAIDRPSEKFLGFLNKHYSLNNPVKQMNNYVVFDGFFPSSPEKNGTVELDHSGSSPGKKQSANGLQTTSYTSPLGRYGAPRPTCSMGQIIHNQTSTIPKSTEPTGVVGVRSAPETNYQNVAWNSPGNTNITQSAPNVHYRSQQPKIKLDGLSEKSEYPVTNQTAEQDRSLQQGYQQNIQQPQNNYISQQQPAQFSYEQQQQLVGTAQNISQNQSGLYYNLPPQNEYIPQAQAVPVQNLQPYPQQYPVHYATNYPHNVDIQSQDAVQQNTQMIQNMPQSPAQYTYNQSQIQNEQMQNVVQQPSLNMGNAHQYSVSNPTNVEQGILQPSPVTSYPQKSDQTATYSAPQQPVNNPSQQYQQPVSQTNMQHNYAPSNNIEPMSYQQQNSEQKNLLMQQNTPSNIATSMQYNPVSYPNTQNVQNSANNTQSVPSVNTPSYYDPAMTGQQQPPSNASGFLPQTNIQNTQYPTNTTQSVPNMNIPTYYNATIASQQPQTVVSGEYVPQQNLPSLEPQYQQQNMVQPVQSHPTLNQNQIPQAQVAKEFALQPNVIMNQYTTTNQNQIPPTHVTSQPRMPMQPIAIMNQQHPTTNQNQIPPTHVTSQPTTTINEHNTGQSQNIKASSIYTLPHQPSQMQYQTANPQIQQHIEGNQLIKASERITNAPAHYTNGDIGSSEPVTFEYGYPPQIPDSGTQVMEEKVSPSPKLERPRSLSIQLSEEQTEDKKNDVESEVPPNETQVEEVIEKLDISENGNGINQKEENLPETEKTHGKKTPSHLTEQGFFDLKFYHNKLW